MITFKDMCKLRGIMRYNTGRWFYPAYGFLRVGPYPTALICYCAMIRDRGGLS